MLVQDSLETLATELDLLVAFGLMQNEVTRLCGRCYELEAERVHTRYGHQRRVATLAGQKVVITHPRVRQVDGGGEVPLEMYSRLQSPEAILKALLRHMVRKINICKYEYFIDMARNCFGVATLSVSPKFVRASAAEVKALAERSASSKLKIRVGKTNPGWETPVNKEVSHVQEVHRSFVSPSKNAKFARMLSRNSRDRRRRCVGRKFC